MDFKGLTVPYYDVQINSELFASPKVFVSSVAIPLEF